MLAHVFQLSSPPASRSGKLFKKELIRVGSFVKREGDNVQKFSVTAEDIDHWVGTFDAMQQAGVDVPVPLEHTSDPEKNRGYVVAMERGVNDRGEPALFGYIQFRDDEAEKLASSTDVSIYVPNEFTDSSDRTYKRPIRHVALTTYPVISSLGDFEAIAASFVEGEKNMPLRKLALKLGLKPKDDEKDEDIEASIVSAFENMKPKPKKDEDEDEKKPIAAGFVQLAKRVREQELEKLVSQRRISPAVRDELSKQFCNDGTLALSYSTDGKASDGFDAMILALSKNEPIIAGESTGPQTMTLSHASDGKPNPLVANAKKRAAASK